MTSPREPIFTPRLQLGFGLLAFGLGLMFFCGKVVPAPIPAGIALGIALGFTGLVVVVVEALRDGPTGPDEVRPDGAPTGGQVSPPQPAKPGDPG